MYYCYNIFRPCFQAESARIIEGAIYEIKNSEERLYAYKTPVGQFVEP